MIGSAGLSPHERALTARVHVVVTLEPDTVMVKVLAPGAVERYLLAEVSAGVAGAVPPFDHRLVGGMVARLQDCVRLRGPRDHHRAFRLDYPGSPFHPDAPVLHTLEFAVSRPDRCLVPFGAPADRSVDRAVGYAMAATALAEGVEPNSVRTEFAPWPFTGTGLTAGGPLALPEWWMTPGLVPPGSRIMAHTAAGACPVAVLRRGVWGDLR